MLLRSNSRPLRPSDIIEQASRSRRTAEALANLQFPEANLTNLNDFNDNIPDTMLDYRYSRVNSGGGGYATHIARSSSDGNFAGYARQLYEDDDGVSSISQSHLGLACFGRGGLLRRYHSEYGRGLSTLLRSELNEDDEPSTNDTAADDVKARSEERCDNDNRRGSSPSVDGDKASSVSNFPCSRISPTHYFTFGLGPDTKLTGSQTSITSHVTTDEAQTNVQEGRGKKMATSQQNSVPVMEWLRNRRRRPSNAVKIELEQRSGKSSIFRRDSDSVSENNGRDRYTKPDPESHLLGVTTELVMNNY